MSEPEAPRRRPLLILLTSHWMSQVGLGLVFTALVTWLFLIRAELRGGGDNPYIGVAFVVIVPAGLFLGLLLLVLGVWRGRRLSATRLGASIDDRRVALRRLAWFLGITAVVNVALGTQVTYRGIHHMESRQFCSSCHVMTPESTAFNPGPHGGLLCVDCHVGQGARGFIESKIQGTRQLIHVLTDSVETPIASGIASGRMVSSDQTCERCHWKEMPGRVNLQISRKYAEDEQNTPETTVLTMHVGGTLMGGIHGAHCAPGVEIRFVPTDPARQDIPVVEYSNANTGVARTYVRDDADAADYAGIAPVTMQCIDCHNRAAHRFESPGGALDSALTFGQMSSTLPYLKLKGMELLEQEYDSREAAAQAIPTALSDYYREEHPEVFAERAADVARAGEVIAAIHTRNVFPDLGVTWGTYPDNNGHEDYPGCYRCHEGKHATEDGLRITKSCVKCHTPSAVADTDPQILRELGLKQTIDRMRSQ